MPDWQGGVGKTRREICEVQDEKGVEDVGADCKGLLIYRAYDGA